MRKITGDSAALWTLFVLSSCMLLMCILFVASAKGPSARAADPTAQEYMQAQQEQLAVKEALAEELAATEAALKEAEAENTKLEKQNLKLNDQNEELNEAQVEMLDSLNMKYMGKYYTTSYCCERYPHICGGNGVTASGTVPTPGLTIAADWKVMKPGTWVYIEGVGLRRVEDSGSAIKGKRIDVAVDTHANALRWSGQGSHHVWVLDFEGLPD